MSDIPDIDPGDAGGDAGGDIGISPAVGAAAVLCLSCSAAIVGAYCANCGQKNDDMRRSSFVLLKDFIKDTFAFDGRMWRTLGLMAVMPGTVPTNYSHGKRSRYTPPVRLFLVVSFLFFLVLGVTQTMFVAFDVEAKSAEEIAADRKSREAAAKEVDKALADARADLADDGAVLIDGQTVDCDIKAKVRFFVRPADINVDEAKWRACADSIARAATAEIKDEKEEFAAADSKGDIGNSDVLRGFQRVLDGVNMMVADPPAFNSHINTWLPRVMFFMAPVLALILALFIRGRNALLFDHLVLSLYSHAAAFAIIGVAILLGQFGVPYVFPAAIAALGVYFVAALRRAYRRGWVKTVYSAAFTGLIYLVILVSVVSAIIVRQIWSAAA